MGKWWDADFGLRLRTLGWCCWSDGSVYSLLASQCSLLLDHVTFSIALIVFDRSSHWVVSACSCFRPAGVSA